MRTRILELIAEHFNIDADDINRETSFTEDLGADSIELVEFVMSLEDEFDIELDDEKLEELKTVGDVLDYCEDLE